MTSLHNTPVELLQSEIENLQFEVVELKAKLAWYQEQFKLTQHKRFAASSEREEGQGQLFNEAEAVTDQLPAEEPESETVAAHTRKKPKRRLLSENTTLPRTIETIDLPEDEKQCGCGLQHFKIGEEVSFKLKIEPARAELVLRLLKSIAANTAVSVKTGLKPPPCPNSPFLKAWRHRNC